MSANIEIEKKIVERENILLYGAVDQYLFEHKIYSQNFDHITQEEKAKYFLNLIMNRSEEIIQSYTDDIFVFDI